MQRDIVMFMPNVLTYERAIRSALAFDELYGEEGQRIESVVILSSGEDGPYTSSVLI